LFVVQAAPFHVLREGRLDNAHVEWLLGIGRFAQKQRAPGVRQDHDGGGGGQPPVTPRSLLRGQGQQRIYQRQDERNEADTAHGGKLQQPEIGPLAVPERAPAKPSEKPGFEKFQERPEQRQTERIAKPRRLPARMHPDRAGQRPEQRQQQAEQLVSEHREAADPVDVRYLPLQQDRVKNPAGGEELRGRFERARAPNAPEQEGRRNPREPVEVP